MKKVGNIIFPDFRGVRCYMMPFIQGRPETLPEEFASYRDAVASMVLSGEDGEVGLLTIDESFVEAGASQRGYGNGSRTIHTEACLKEGKMRWGSSWGRGTGVLLAPETRGLIANSIGGTCAVWDTEVLDTSEDGDLSHRANEFSRETAYIMGAGDVVEIGIFTPHEPIAQRVSGPRQFVRVMGQGVYGREEYFTQNPLLAA